MSKWVLVTGSSRGIGQSIAMALANEGYNLVLHCVQARQLADQAAQDIQALGRECRVLQFDVSDRAACVDAITTDIELHGAYYGVVLNAGIARDTAFPAMTDDEWDDVLHTNLDSFYNVLKPIIMPMVRRRQPGRIITLSSVSGVVGNRGQVNYSASKAGLIGATKALALELAKREITVNCVAPGLIETEMTKSLETDHLLQHIPLRRAGKMQEVAATVLFLLSDGAGYITRQVISVNGGLC